MAETIDTLQVDLTANLAPLFAALDSGLKQVRDKVQAFKDGKVEVTASADKMLGQLGEAKAKAGAWKRETDSVSVVQPSVNSGGFIQGLSDLRSKAESVARALGNVFFAAAGFREIISVFGEWVKASGDQEVALARLRSALSASGAAGISAFEPLKAQAEELATRYGQFGDEAIQSGQAVLASFKLTGAQIEALTPVLLDAATGLTKMGEGEVSLEEVAMLVGKALNGHAEALQRLGIQVDLARYKLDPLGATMDALNRRFQGLTAAVAGTDQGKLKSLAERWGEIEKALGNMVKAVLLPLIEALKPVMNAFLALPEPVQRAAVVIGIAAVAMRAMNVTLVEVAARLLVFVDTLGAGAVAAVSRLAAALATLNWAQMTGGIAAATQSLAAFANGMGMAGKAILTVGAFWAGWQIGRWISDVTGLTAATSRAAEADRTWSDAEIERFAAQLRAKTGLDLSAAAMRIWITLSAEMRQKLMDEARATGDLMITVEDLTRAMQAQSAEQAALARQSLWSDEKRQLADFLSYYRSSRASQIATDIAAAEARVQAAAKGSKEEEAAQQELTQLLRQAAQEKVRQEEGAASRAQAAWKASFDAQKAKVLELVKTISEQAAQARAKWADLAQSMAGDLLKAMDPTEYERSQVRIQAADNERAARATLQGQALADALVQIERWKAEQIGAINDKALQDEAEKQKQALDKEREQALRAHQQAMQRLRQQVQAILDPMQAMVERAYQSMSVAAAVWAERVASMMQPLQQAIYSFLTGMKVNWSNVLRQMIAQFVMQFVSKFLAWVAEMVVAWITGETSKSSASAVGAAEQVAAATVVRTANAGVAASAMSVTIAEIFAAHAWIPYVGVAIAAAFSAVALGIWAGLSGAATGIAMAGAAMATGGLVDRPTWTLSGEAGPELFAPVSGFQAVVGSLLADTVATTRMAAIGVGNEMRGGAGGPGSAFTWEPHYHGFAFVDSGNRGYMRAAARKMTKALSDQARQRLGR